MNALEKIGLLEDRFLSGEASVGELPLGLEPLLWQVSQGKLDEGAIRKIMNDLELILFTLPTDQQAASVAKLLKNARAFIETRACAD
jgi:hypothetical protein